MAIYDYEAIGGHPRWGEDDRSNNWLNGWLKLTQLVLREPQALQKR